ncbi:MAG: nucleotidyltransferase domain-containing protein [Desulfobacterales bacterium]|nr:nucleotidyltransferase domain-containing protein [Desulfobacterales bacterium]
MIEEIIKKYFEGRKEIIAIYLFGSYALGKERHMSDVDIGVLLNHTHSKQSEVLKEEYMIQLGRLLRKDIHPVILNTAGEVLLKQILGKGKLLLVKNPKFHKEFKMVSLSRIVDFSCYLKKMHSSLTKKILEA